MYLEDNPDQAPAAAPQIQAPARDENGPVNASNSDNEMDADPGTPAQYTESQFAAIQDDADQPFSHEQQETSSPLSTPSQNGLPANANSIFSPRPAKRRRLSLGGASSTGLGNQEQASSSPLMTPNHPHNLPAPGSTDGIRPLPSALQMAANGPVLPLPEIKPEISSMSPPRQPSTRSGEVVKLYEEDNILSGIIRTFEDAGKEQIPRLKADWEKVRRELDSMEESVASAQRVSLAVRHEFAKAKMCMQEYQDDLDQIVKKIDTAKRHLTYLREFRRENPSAPDDDAEALAAQKLARLSSEKVKYEVLVNAEETKTYGLQTKMAQTAAGVEQMKDPAHLTKLKQAEAEAKLRYNDAVAFLNSMHLGPAKLGQVTRRGYGLTAEERVGLHLPLYRP
ncbi:hypothetical protein B0H63DRAFT_471337 [Podospora didyma]|uniref:Uncharacterized protein n=1 Tax=Podospora didyma TaxID=330526 RepID=A0AAE0NV54_9PEZI|nr:hypothetical protein B0H63DRAFT_471337 [Podospora didyma]